ncbi:MAG: ribonuclease P protein component [Phycisphaerae bacterium]|nr:ribonuclease P protein component [Phycisphaerae bacterium]
MKNRLTLSKKQRLVKNSEFKAVLAQRHRCSDPFLVVHMARNTVGYTRLGVSVGRSQGNAVIRNRIKRVIRETFRVHQQEMPCGFDVLVTMARPRRQGGRQAAVTRSISDLSWTAMNDSLAKLVGLCHKKMCDS